jgi:hypothetical protein
MGGFHIIALPDDNSLKWSIHATRKNANKNPKCNKDVQMGES